MTGDLNSKIKQLPNLPGVYLFKDGGGLLLYIGKAKSLKKRVSSYFAKNHEDVKTNELVKKIADVEFITTKNEVEALLLEASLIQKNQPPYNIDLKSGRGRYAYLKITADKFPRVVVARHINDLKTGKIFGPYTSATTRRETQYWANAILQAQSGDAFPPPSYLLRQLKVGGLTPARNLSEAELSANVKKAGQFLRGDIKELKIALEREMKVFSQAAKYEQAKLRRDQLAALTKLDEAQTIDLPKGYDQDVFDYISTPEGITVQLFNIKKGLISGRQELKAGGSDFSEFLRRYYDAHEIPEEIILPTKLTDQSVLGQYFSKLKGKKIAITIPQKGSKKELLALLRQNLEISARVGNAVLAELQNVLNLPTLLQTIEMFDISHTGGKEIVASMVQFVDGQPNKSGYRKFKMRTVKNNDDFASMREVVRRRYERLLKERKKLPDLIIVDGGRGQLSAALGVLRDLGIITPLIALAKKNEEIYTISRRFPVRLSKTSETLKLVQRIRDEAHRFAIIFHRQRRSKQMLLKYMYMTEQFPKQPNHASTIRQELINRGVGQPIKPKGKNELSAGDQKPLPDLAIPDTEKIPPEELSPDDRLQLINAVVVKCGWNPEEVEAKEKEILKLMPEHKCKNKRDAEAKKAQAIRNWERADKDYQKELKSIEEMSTNAFQALNNEILIKKAQERACKEIIKIIAAKKIIKSAELFLEVTI